MVEKTKKGPKEIESFIFFFLHKISMKESNAPVKNAMYRAKTIFGKPRNKPIRKTSFTSPKPIPLPLVIKKINRKKTNAPRPARTEFRIKNWVVARTEFRIKKIRENKIKG